MIKVEITYAAQDMQESFDLHYKKMFPYRSKILIFLGYVFIVGGLLILIVNSYHNTFNFFPFISIAYGILIFFLHYWRYKNIGKRLFKKMLEFRFPFQYEFSEEGVKIEGYNISTKVKWNYFQKAIVSDNLILLFPNRFRFNFFPRKYFSETDYVLLSNLVKKNIKDCL